MAIGRKSQLLTEAGCLPTRAVANVREASAVTGLSERSIYRAVARGEFAPRVRLSPRRFGFRLVDLLAWIEARCEQNEAKVQPSHQSPRRGV
jgi:predicted DNA-binding transcriptional regulator AlpA